MAVPRKNTASAAHLLNGILQDGDQRELLIALREISEDFGGMPKIAREAHLNRTQLYRMLSDQGNPKVRSLMAILRTMGLRLAVQPAPRGARTRHRRRRAGA